jgi:hypothetical protein
MKPSVAVLALMGVLAAAPAATADFLTPFYTRNQNPLVQIFGLPAAESARLLSAGSQAAFLVVDAANSFSQRTRAAEDIMLDGETYRTTLVLRFAGRDRLELGLDLPYVSHTGGSFDGFIDSWHNFIGVGDGGREQVDRNQLRYRYDDGQERAGIQSSTSGIGDVMLTAAVPVYGGNTGDRLLALRTALKLPTGSTSGLRGSGSTDLSVRLLGEDRQSLARWNLGLFGGAGLLLMSDSDIISRRQRRAVGFGTLGLGWQPLSWLALKIQLDGHSPFYRSELTELGHFSAQLVMGGTVGLSRGLQLDLAVSEDIIVHTAPDVVFHLALRRVFCNPR